MKVSLIDYTGKGLGPRSAAELMVFTKSTRLKMTPGLFDSIKEMSDLEIDKELDYMSKTIPSSWEFCHYTFLIEGVTRAFTHQFVRTRNGSYAQQTMRILDVSGFTYHTGPSISGDEILESQYDDVMKYINQAYDELIANGATIEDARGILPTNIHTNIVASFNLRTLAEMISKRSSSRTQDEYRDVILAMSDAILDVHPWAFRFIANRKLDAAGQLEELIMMMPDMDRDEKTAFIKLIDILRG
jgi:flavin-dependent thymidylate synthase